MRKIILQHATAAQQDILNAVQATNKAYADKFGFEYTTDSTLRVTDGRDPCWEKIAYLNAFLPTVDGGSLVVWEDADSLNIGDESLENALPQSGVLGLVQNRGGHNCSSLINWFNSGIMVMVNCQTVRDFFVNVWNRGGKDDERGIMAELNHTNSIGNGKTITSMDPKWNCWRNNAHLCASPVIKTFHGMKPDLKLAAIQAALAS